MSSPEVSPTRVEVAAVIEAGPLDVHATSAGGGALSSPPSDTGAVTLPELATEADATSGAEAANETLAAAESNAVEAALSDHTVAEPAPAHCVQPDIASVPCVQPRVDKEGNIFVSATTLFKNVVPAVSSDVLFQEDPIEKADVVEDDGPTDDTQYQGSPGVFVPTMLLFPDIDPPMWNFTSQSPVSKPAVAPSPDVPFDVDGANNPSQSLSNATATLVLFVSSDALDDIPEGIPLGAPVGVTSSNNEDAPVGCANPSSTGRAPGDLFHEFEPEGLVPLSCSFPTAPVEKQSVRSDKGKASVKDVSSVISLDDLLVQKFGAEGSDRLQNSTLLCNQDIHYVKALAITTAGHNPVSLSITPRTRLRTLSFPVLQTLGVPRKGKKPIGHWYVLSLNMGAKRFEILDSIRGEDDMDKIEHANKLVEAIKTMYKINYSDSYRQIDDFELMYIPVPKQKKGTDCGFFMLKFLELWNDSVVPAISQDQIPALRKVLTSLWLEHDRNDLINWRILLDNNMI
ncbi:hypothetical protein ACQ4PT_024057 [Festuca glaucescens]